MGVVVSDPNGTKGMGATPLGVPRAFLREEASGQDTKTLQGMFETATGKPDAAEPLLRLLDPPRRLPGRGATRLKELHPVLLKGLAFRGSAEHRQPLLAAGKHTLDEIKKSSGRVEMKKKAAHGLGDIPFPRGLFKEQPCGGAVHRLGVLRGSAMRQGPRPLWTTAHDAEGELVDRVDAKTQGKLGLVPVASPGMITNASGQRAEFAPAVAFARAQGIKHTLGHFAGGLAREGEGDDLLRMFDRGEKGEITGGKQRRFPRTRRRLHEK